jgi:pimeloyl-ACP methyl ester carboxylesterase
VIAPDRIGVVPLAQHWPQLIYQMMLGFVPLSDRAVLKRGLVRTAITASMKESIRQGADALLQEMALYTRPWGFDPAEITIPANIWHGTEDETVPLLHGQSLADSLPRSEIHLIEGEGHYSLPVDRMDLILEKLITERNGLTNTQAT